MGLFGGKGSKAGDIPRYTGLQIQTSSNSVPITILYGTNMIAPNAIWTGGFYSIADFGKGGGGKGGGKQLQGYTYYTSFAMGLCEGPINNYATMWEGQKFLWSLSGSGLTQATGGSTPQTPWGWLSTFWPGQDLGYNGLAYIGGAAYNLGSSPNLPQFRFEIHGITGPGNSIWAGNVINGIDSDPALIIQDFLTNAQYGVGFPASSIDASTLLGVSRSSTVTLTIASPCVVAWNAHGLANGQGVFFTTTGALPTGLTAGVTYYVVAAAANTFEVAAAPDGTPINTSGTQSGTHTAATAVSTYQAYCRANRLAMSPAITSIEKANSIIARWLQLTNTAAVWSGGKLKFIPYGDTQVTGSTFAGNVTFTPNVTPLFDLGDDDFIHEDGADPIEVERSDPYSTFNWQRLQYTERYNAYSSAPMEAWDQNSIELYGLRRAPDITAAEFCDWGIAQIAAQLILQRQLYIRNTYKFKLSFEYCLLEPMDLVNINDAGLGLAGATARIVSIEEDESGLLSVVAEEFPGGTGTAVAYQVQRGHGTPPDQGVVPARVNAPIIYEPPASLNGGTAQIWAAVSGGVATAYKLAETAATGLHQASQVISDTLILNDTVVISIYAQAKERTKLSLLLYNGSTYPECDFDLTAVTSTPGTGVATSSIADAGPGAGGLRWYLCTATVNMAATAAPIFYVRVHDAAGADSYTGISGDGIFIWGAAVAWSRGGVTPVSVDPTFLPAFTGLVNVTLTVDATPTPEGVAGIGDPNWGGAFVWLSADGSTYGQIGTAKAGARQGFLTATLAAPPGLNPDTADTLSVDLAESRGQLASATNLDAQNGVTLCLVDKELLAYGTASLVSGFAYNLTYLWRGHYGTTPVSHLNGAPFVRLDDAIFKANLPDAYVGVTLYMKFQSFNIFGNAVEDLSECAVYTYTPTGAGQPLGPVAYQLYTGHDLDYGLITEAVVTLDDFGLVSTAPNPQFIDMESGTPP